MSEPLQDNDPRQLGAYRLSGRAGVRPEGVVYLAHTSSGTPVSVAMLSEGAAADPAARDRFVAAVTKGSGIANPPTVLASNTSNPAASWVAVRHSDTGPNAGAYLEPVGVEPTRGSHSPGYLPYWAGAQGPATARWSWRGSGGRAATATQPGTNRAVIVGLLLLLLLIIALLAVLYMWLSQFSQQAMVDVETPSPSPSPSEQESPQEEQEEEQESSPSPEDPEPGEDQSNQPSPVESPSGDVPSVPLEEGEDSSGVPEDPSQIP